MTQETQGNELGHTALDGFLKHTTHKRCTKEETARLDTTMDKVLLRRVQIYVAEHKSEYPSLGQLLDVVVKQFLDSHDQKKEQLEEKTHDILR